MSRLLSALVTLGCTVWTGAAQGQLSGPVPLPGDAAPAPLAGQKFEPHVAAGNGEFLLVWLDRRGMLTPTVEGDPWEVQQADIYAHRLDASGAPIGAPIRVDGSAYSQEAPRAAFNGTDWLVVYESRSLSSTGFYSTQDIRATRVSGSGQVLDSVALAIDMEDTETYAPCIASDGTDWAVFWTTAFTTFGRKVFADGTLGPVTTAFNPNSWHFDPEVAFAGDRYLLVWEPGTQGRLLDTNLAPIGGVFTIGTYSDPQVATDGTDFFVSYANLGQWAELFGTVVRKDGTVVSPGGQPLDAGTYLALEPAAITWDGSGYLATWTEYRYVFPNGPEESLLMNRFDSSGDPVWTDPVTVELSQEFSIRNPMTASLGGDVALLGWMDSRYGTQNTPTGQAVLADSSGTVLTSPECTMVGAPAQLHPDLVRGPTGATPAEDVDLAVFVSVDAEETRVVYQRIDGLGNVLDPEPVLVAGGLDTYTNPTAAWNGALWLVVWEDRFGGTSNGGALAARISSDGTVLDTTPIEVVEGNDPDVGSLAVIGGDFLVVASQRTSNDIRTLYGQRVASDGSLLGAKTFLGVNYAVTPSVDGFDDRWIVFWTRKPSHDSPTDLLAARFLFADGTTGPVLDPSNSTADEVLPDVQVDGGIATFVWGDGSDIRLRQMDKNGTFLGDPAGLVVSSAPEEQTAPTVAHDGEKTVITWVDDRIHTFLEPGQGDLFGARLDSSLANLDPNGAALAADPFAPEGEAALSGRLGETNALFPGMLPSFGQWRLALARWTSESQPLLYCTAKTSSAGCLASIGTSDIAAQPISGASDYSISANGVQAFKNGLLFGSLSGAATLPFNGGVLCMNAPLKRGPVLGSGGTSPTACDGGFATLVNDGAVIPTGLDGGPGNTTCYQYWYRDPQNGVGLLGTSLSNAVELTFE